MKIGGFSMGKSSKRGKRSGNERVVAVLSYLTIIGWIVALLLHLNEKSRLGAYHLKQSLALLISWAVLMFVPLIGMLLRLVLLVLWVFGLVYAVQGVEKPVPLIGGTAEKVFKELL